MLVGDPYLLKRDPHCFKDIVLCVCVCVCFFFFAAVVW